MLDKNHMKSASGQPPIDRLLPQFNQSLIGKVEMTTAEKTAMGRQWRRMRGFKQCVRASRE